MVILISQRIIQTERGFLDSLEHTYLDYFEKRDIDLFPIPNIKGSLNSYLSLPIQGIVLTGGGDIEEEIAIKRNRIEKALLSFAIKNKIPVLGICRGMQFVNFYFGGKLERLNNKKSHVNAQHLITIIDPKIKRLIGDKIITNSYHNWGIKNEGLSKELIAFAISEEGNIEGIYHPKLPILGIQWHPERKNTDKSANEGLINALLNKSLWEK